MKVLVTTEQRFHRANGRVVTTGPLGYDFWTRYRDVFDEVGVLARVHAAPGPPGARDVAGPGVRVLEVPAYVGARGYARALPGLRRTVDEAAAGWGAIVVRAPSPLGALLLGRLREGRRRAFGLEVVGDPSEVFARSGVRHPLRAVFRWWFSAQLRRLCRQAAALSYVTRHTLQVRYPPRAGSPPQFVTACSSVDLPASALARRARTPGSFAPPFRLVTVASLEQAYKGVDAVLGAVGVCRRQGLPVELTVVGDGRERSSLEGLTRSLSLADHVAFVGQVPPEGVNAHLDASGLFVLASGTEGLPRSMIEAMARALPCVGTDVGGIVELLSAADRVPPGSVTALAERLVSVLGDPARLAAMSARNLVIAREYTSEVLRPRRRRFLEAVETAALAARKEPGA